MGARGMTATERKLAFEREKLRELKGPKVTTQSTTTKEPNALDVEKARSRAAMDRLGMQLGHDAESLAQRLGLEADKLEAKQEMFGQELGLKGDMFRHERNMDRSKQDLQARLGFGELGLKQDELGFKKDIWGPEQRTDEFRNLLKVLDSDFTSTAEREQARSLLQGLMPKAADSLATGQRLGQEGVRPPQGGGYQDWSRGFGMGIGQGAKPYGAGDPEQQRKIEEHNRSWDEERRARRAFGLGPSMLTPSAYSEEIG